MILDCELSKDVDVMWYHNEVEIKASKMVTIKAEGKCRTLIINKVGDKDKGQYVCDCGTDKTTATLYIEGKRGFSVEATYVIKWPFFCRSSFCRSTSALFVSVCSFCCSVFNV